MVVPLCMHILLVNLLWRDTYAYISVFVQCSTYADATILSSKLGWFESSQTIIRIPFRIYYAIQAPYYSPYLFSCDNVSPHYFHMFYRQFMGSFLWSNHPFCPLISHMILSCLLILWYHFPLRCMLYLLLLYIDCITPCTSNCRQIGVYFPASCLFNIQ